MTSQPRINTNNHEFKYSGEQSPQRPRIAVRKFVSIRGYLLSVGYAVFGVFGNDGTDLFIPQPLSFRGFF
jgi:hypothetical protein